MWSSSFPSMHVPCVFSCSPPKANSFPTVWAFRTSWWVCIYLMLHKISIVSPLDLTPEDFVCPYHCVLIAEHFWPILNELQISIWQIVQPLPETRDFTCRFRTSAFWWVSDTMWHPPSYGVNFPASEFCPIPLAFLSSTKQVLEKGVNVKKLQQVTEQKSWSLANNQDFK